MDYDNIDNSVIILKDNNKRSFLEKISSIDKLLDIKIITLSEFKKKYFFDYDKETCYYICQKYSCIYDIAKIYIQNLYYIDETKSYDDPKLKFLKDLKLDLRKNSLIKENKLFREFIKRQKIILYNLSFEDKYYLNIFEHFENVTSYDETHEKTKTDLYSLQNKEEEVYFVASYISDLIKNGIDINKIKLANVKDEYIFEIDKTFKLFNIPINGLINSKASGTKIIKKFIEEFSSDIENTFEKLNEIVTSEKDKKLVKKIINIINEYSFSRNLNDVKELIIKDVKNITLEHEKLDNAVSIINFLGDEIKDDEYVFLLNFNQGSLPHNNKDEDYLSDKLKELLNIDTSINANSKALKFVQKKIEETKNLIVTYSKNSLNEELYISNAYESNLFNEKDSIKSFNHSDFYNKIILTQELDEFYKFGGKSDDLIRLYNHYNDFSYNNYLNKFKGIERSKIDNFFKDGFVLSYTSINDFYHCAFKYYLNNVVKVGKYEDTFLTTVGNIYHYVLSKCYLDSFDFEESFTHALENSNYEFKSSEKYYINILKEELKVIIDILYKQEEYSTLDTSLYEQKIVVDLKDNVIFKGFVDKMKLKRTPSSDICFIIDYKTGNPTNSLDKVLYGLDMQLPVYIYLIKRFDKLKNVRIGGFYLQKILSNELDESLKEKALRLDGFSNSDLNILSLIDNNYENSNVIQGMKTVKSGGFSSYAKVLSDEQINKLDNIVEEKILNAKNKIKNAEFEINPKKIGRNLEGCKWCKFKDICYMKNDDIVELKEQKYKDFLGGE